MTPPGDQSSIGMKRVCPRCDAEQDLRDFQGEVCAWCADDLEAAAIATGWAGSPEVPADQEDDFRDHEANP